MEGRRILVQAVIDSIPIFWFNLCIIPMGVITKLEKIRRKFIWGERLQGLRKIHLLKWDKVCKKKENGGLGLVPISIRNTPLLDKWWY